MVLKIKIDKDIDNEWWLASFHIVSTCLPLIKHFERLDFISNPK